MDQDPKGSIFYTDVSYSLDQVIIRKDCKIFPKCYKEGRRATTNITASSLPPKNPRVTFGCCRDALVTKVIGV